MTDATTGAIDMARKAAQPPQSPDDQPIGPILAANLIRLGYAKVIVQTDKISRLVCEKTGKTMSRQRISAILNAVRVTPSTIKTLADAIGVKPSELTRPPK